LKAKGRFASRKCCWRRQQKRAFVGRDVTPLPLGFVEVLILQGDKVLCFDTLLEVLILKVVSGARRWLGSDGGGWTDLAGGVKGNARSRDMFSKAVCKDHARQTTPL
jgi:hypothetical protein